MADQCMLFPGMDNGDPPKVKAKHAGKYRLIYADPCWQYDNYGLKDHGAVRAHYSTLTGAELSQMPVADLAHPDGCLVLMWITTPKLPVGLQVMEAWGFTYTTKAFYWRKVYAGTCVCGHRAEQHATTRLPGFDAPVVQCSGQHCRCSRLAPKPYCGLGYYTRSSGESCYLGRSGKASFKPARRDVVEEVEAGVREHSRKPDEVYALIDALWPDARPRLELFARGPARDGWDAWGDEVPDAVDLF